MPGITRTLTFAEGVETTGPTTTFLQTTEFAVYADDATYVSNKGSAAENGDAYYNSTSHLLRIYANGAWINYVDTGTAQTLTNKTLTSPGINGANLNMGTASNTNRILLPNDTTTNLDALTDTEALIAYDTTLKKVVFNDTTGWNVLSVGGVSSTVSKTTTYTATTSDEIIFCDTSGGAFTITLYAASGNAGRKLTFIKTSSDLNALTVDGNASETINGNTTTTVNTQYERLEIVCNGTNWIILSRKSYKSWATFTPTGSWTSNVTYAGKWRRLEENIEISYRVFCNGAPGPTATNLTFNPVSGITQDTSKSISASTYVRASALTDASVGRMGIVWADVSSSIVTPYAIRPLTTDNHVAVNLNSDSGLPFTFAINDYVDVIVSYPVTGWKGQDE